MLRFLSKGAAPRLTAESFPHSALVASQPCFSLSCCLSFSLCSGSSLLLLSGPWVLVKVMGTVRVCRLCESLTTSSYFWNCWGQGQSRVGRAGHGEALCPQRLTSVGCISWGFLPLDSDGNCPWEAPAIDQRVLRGRGGDTPSTPAPSPAQPPSADPFLQLSRVPATGPSLPLPGLGEAVLFPALLRFQRTCHPVAFPGAQSSRPWGHDLGKV